MSIKFSTANGMNNSLKIVSENSLFNFSSISETEIQIFFPLFIKHLIASKYSAFNFKQLGLLPS